MSLDAKTSELAAVAASVAANCLPCLKYHFSKAKDSGCSIDDIREAIKIADMVKQQPAKHMQELVEQLLL